MKHTILTISLILHSSFFILHSASAAVPLRWTVETSRAQPATFDAYQGETLSFEAALQSYGKPLEAPLNYAFYWQTNGMGNAYWSSSCASLLAATNVLRATWLPSYDVGARVYNCFIGLTGSIFRAAFQLRLRPSPGAVPNELPLPQKVIDFSKVTVLNPTWPTDATITNTVAEIANHAIITNSNIIQNPYISDIAMRVIGMQNNVVFREDLEPLSADIVGHAIATNATVSGALQMTNETGTAHVGWNGDVFNFSYGISVNQSPSIFPDDLDGFFFGERSMQSLLDEKADASDIAPLSIGYQRLYSFQTSATNVNISVTNYPPTAEEAEGRTHFDPTAPDPDLDFSTVPASLRVDETRGGKRTVVDTRDWPFWYFTSKLPGILAAAREYANEAYTNALVNLAAWASRTATGAENPAGDSTLVVDVPNIWLMTDQTFEKHVAGSNSCWVIRSKNATVSPGVATNGFLELTDAFGSPYIRFNKTEATFADPPADGISYDADAGEWLISYSTESQPRGGANVTLQGSADYPGKAILKEADDPLCPAVITWSGSARNWVMHARPKQIDGIDPGRMFFGAVVEIDGQDYIEYLKPVSFSHIVLPNGKKIAPDVPQSATVGSTVTWKVVL